MSPDHRSTGQGCRGPPSPRSSALPVPQERCSEGAATPGHIVCSKQMPCAPWPANQGAPGAAPLNPVVSARKTEHFLLMEIPTHRTFPKSSERLLTKSCYKSGFILKHSLWMQQAIEHCCRARSPQKGTGTGVVLNHSIKFLPSGSRRRAVEKPIG